MVPFLTKYCLHGLADVPNQLHILGVLVLWDSFVCSTGHGIYPKQNIPFSLGKHSPTELYGETLSIDLGQSHGAGF